MCKFSGLAAFPYDNLKCAIEFGGWGLSGGHQGLVLKGDGYALTSPEVSFSSQETSYQEYSIIDVSCSLRNVFTDGKPHEPWPVVK